MIFTGIKRKSNQLFYKKKCESLVNKFRSKGIDKIKTVLVITDDVALYDPLKKLFSGLLNLDENSVDIIVFQKKKPNLAENENIISQHDFGWYGAVKSEFLKKILTKKHDLLINYSKIENLYCNLLILQSDSGFRAGFAGVDSRLYDLMIDSSYKDKKTFGSELKKYLQILNKIG